MSYDPRDRSGTSQSSAPSMGATPKDRLAGLARAAKGSKRSKAPKPGKSKGSSGKPPRKAHLQVASFELVSVMKFSFVMSLVGFVILLVAVMVLYVVLAMLGVFDAITSTVNDLTREQGSNESGLNAASWFSFGRVFGYTVLVGSLNVLFITALSTVGAMIYNTVADVVGGVQVTLKEADLD